MYGYHPNRRSPSDGSWTVQDSLPMVNDTVPNISGFPTATTHVSQLPNSFPWPPEGQDNQHQHFGFALDTMGGTMQGDTLAGPSDAQWDAYYDPQLNDSPPAWNQGQIPLIFEAPVVTPSLAPPTSQSASTAATPVPSHNSPEPSLPPATIGYIQSGDDYVFRCSRPACRNKRFGRWADLKRHIDAFHDVKEKGLWCPVSACARSKAFGDKPFCTTRKDKLMEHIRRMHC